MWLYSMNIILSYAIFRIIIKYVDHYFNGVITANISVCTILENMYNYYHHNIKIIL